MNLKHLIFAGLLVFASQLQVIAEALQTTIPEKRQQAWWEPRHQEKLAEAKAGDIDLVMVGDSITQGWERQRSYPAVFGPHKVLNLGFGGDRTQHVLWRLQNGEVDGISPKAVSIMVGTNNISRDKPVDIAKGIEAILAELKQRLPQSKIILLAVFPRDHTRTKGDDEEVRELNALLPGLVDNKQVFYHDLSSAFLLKDGSLNTELYGRDQLHLHDKGYEAWAKALNKILASYGLNTSAANDMNEAVQNTSSILRLWPIERVGGEENRLKEVYRDRRGKKQLCGIQDPYLTVYPAKTDKPAPALIYNPGGAYMVLGVPDAAQIKRWNDMGITVFLHKYSIPDQADKAFEDIQRAMRLVRHQARKWNVDPDNIGVLGNSAGGHLSARLSQNYDQKIYDPIDEADKESCEPNFVILQCAAYFHGRPFGKEFDTTLFHFKNDIAPTFLTYSKDDKFYAGGLDYVKRLKEKGIPVFLKAYEKGGHGMGGCDWIPEVATWLKQEKIVE